MESPSANWHQATVDASLFITSKIECPQSRTAKLSQAAAGAGVGAVEEDGQEANGGTARQEADEDQVQPLGLTSRRGHAHLQHAALLEGGCLSQGSRLTLRAAAKCLRSGEALARQQHVGGACHHGQHQEA